MDVGIGIGGLLMTRGLVRVMFERLFESETTGVSTGFGGLLTCGPGPVVMLLEIMLESVTTGVDLGTEDGKLGMPHRTHTPDVTPISSGS